MLDHLPLVEAPDAIWPAIETELDRQRSTPRSHRLAWHWVLAAVSAAAVVCAVYWTFERRDPWIETNAHSRMTLGIGAIGSVELEPGTRLRVVADRPNEHRLVLSHGEIRATISAPPRLFFVDTASATAIDLGCEYTLSANDLGLGSLTVTKGWVSFQWKGVESLIPAGASCRTYPRIGPGIPYFDDAPDNLKQAVDDFGLAKDQEGALKTILALARVRDTLTLWHLLQRVDVPERRLVYDRIAALVPIPAGVSRERALQLDPETLKALKDELAWKW